MVYTLHNYSLFNFYTAVYYKYGGISYEQMPFSLFYTAVFYYYTAVYFKYGGISQEELPFLLFTPRCIINMEAFLRMNCCFLLFSPRYIITENAFSQNVWVIPEKSCRIFLFPPRCFMEERATSDNFCPTSRIFWPCLHSVWARILVCSLLLLLLCPVCISRNS